MKKNLTISIILFFIIFLIGNFVYASGVNMNLTSSPDSTVYGSTNPNARTGNTNQTTTNNINTNTATQNQSTINPTVGPTAALSSSSLSLSNILNIILIVLGVLLVLFAIAILLRLR